MTHLTISDEGKENLKTLISSISFQSAIFSDTIAPGGGNSRLFASISLMGKHHGYKIFLMSEGAQINLSYAENGVISGYISIDCLADKTATDYFMRRIETISADSLYISGCIASL